ncbi:hypothetical protein F511_33242 [Dorcoceras hygrometricum]|uniref:Uncharacterized protein n=1 Tax=Dorcoceras hygrometricum TaxID=472368 RepID=A0A2Z7D192_9LAMI|nr:hypothetical protein F511_33242 [Dorcoceras hygrometricum]
MRPKNLKFQNRSKSAPTSHTAPRPSRPARDRADPTPRRIQPSRHDIAGDSPERRPAGGATTTKIAAATRGAARNSAPQRRASLDSARPGDASKQRQRSASSATSYEFIDQHRTSSSLPPAMSRIIVRQAAAHSNASRCLRSRAASAHKRWAAVGHARREAQQFALASTSARDMRSHIAVDYRQSGPRPDPRLLRQAALEALTRSARTNTPRKTRPEQFPAKFVGGAGGGGDGVS